VGNKDVRKMSDCVVKYPDFCMSLPVKRKYAFQQRLSVGVYVSGNVKGLITPKSKVETCCPR
jgi:hypothetical protein